MPGAIVKHLGAIEYIRQKENSGIVNAFLDALYFQASIVEFYNLKMSVTDAPRRVGIEVVSP